ncbi:hypothetical protein C8Q80DRAFT_830424 [Daedaleopsis nitida]|nr:hypothetical protein C8Q80DRAFT_830424 [Daedaleopsis nitida]
MPVPRLSSLVSITWRHMSVVLTYYDLRSRRTVTCVFQASKSHPPHPSALVVSRAFHFALERDFQAATRRVQVARSDFEIYLGSRMKTSESTRASRIIVGESFANTRSPDGNDTCPSSILWGGKGPCPS